MGQEPTTGVSGTPLPAALLQVAVTPSSVDYSTDSAQSVVVLTITATNATGSAVACSSLTFTIPDALTAAPELVTSAPGPSTPWAIAGTGDGVWSAVPLPPVTEIADGASVSFVLGSVAVGQAQSPSVDIGVTEVSGGVARAGTATVAFAGAAQADPAPVIDTFTAQPAQAALDGAVTLSWSVTGAQSLVLEPGPIALRDPASGSLTLPAAGSTTYTLHALSGGGRVHATAPVAVAPVAIDSFTATPASVAPGGEATLSWSTEFSSACSIDQGVGPVPASATTTVAPEQTTTYTLTARGRDPRTRTATVTVAAT